MATEFQTLLLPPSPVVCASESPRKAKPRQPKMSDATELDVQTAYLAYELLYFILSKDGFRLNGYANGTNGSQRQWPSCVRDPKFQKAFETLKSICLSLKEKHSKEITERVQTLEIGDEHLHGTFHEVLFNTIKDDIRWGRVATLFVFTESLALRLLQERQQDKIHGLVAWLGRFLTENVHDWLREHGGWTGINNIMPKPHPSPNPDAGWLTLAAVGVGAFVLGALLQR